MLKFSANEKNIDAVIDACQAYEKSLKPKSQKYIQSSSSDEGFLSTKSDESLAEKSESDEITSKKSSSDKKSIDQEEVRNDIEHLSVEEKKEEEEEQPPLPEKTGKLKVF